MIESIVEYSLTWLVDSMVIVCICIESDFTRETE